MKEGDGTAAEKKERSTSIFHDDVYMQKKEKGVFDQMKKLSYLLMAVLILGLLLSGCGGGSTAPEPVPADETPADETPTPAEPAAPGQVIEISFAHNGPAEPAHPQNIAANHFKDIVAERSNGELQVTVYPAAQLGNAREVVEALQLGTIEMGDIENGPMGLFVPEANVWDLPYIFEDIDHAHRVLDGEVGQSLQEKFLDIGIRHLAYNDGGFRYFTNSVRPIVEPSDMQGLRIRVMESEVMISTIEAFGGNAIPMSFFEVYSSLEQGVIDGQENPPDLIYDMDFYEVQNYFSISQHFYYPRQYIVSESFFQGLSPEHQEIIQQAAIEACQVQRQETARYGQETLALLDEHMEINEVNQAAFAEIARNDVYPRFYELIGGGDAAAGEALINAILEEGTQ